MFQRLGYRSHESARRLGITRIKTKRYREQKPEPVTEYLSAIQDTPASQIAYVDETGISCCLDREYRWSERGMSLMDVVRGRKFKRTGIVAAKWGTSIIAPPQYDGTMDSTLFETLFASQLLPSLAPNTMIIMNNASLHRKSQLLCLIERAVLRLVFISPYSPS